MAIPGELVHPSNVSGRGLAVRRVRTPVRKRAWNTVRGQAALFVSALFHSDPAEPPVQRFKEAVWLESHWGLQKYCRNQYLRNQVPRSERWRTQGYYAGRPRGVNTPSSEPRKKGLQSFYIRSGMFKQVCRGLGDRKEQDMGE